MYSPLNSFDNAIRPLASESQTRLTQSWLVDVASYKPRRRDEAKLVVSALLRTKGPDDPFSIYLQNMLISFIHTCPSCSSVMIAPMYSPDEELHLYVTRCAAPIAIGAATGWSKCGLHAARTCSNAVCRVCNRICGVPGMPSGPSEPMSEGDPMVYCTDHTLVGTAHMLKCWISVRDTHNIMALFRASNTAAFSSEELDFRAGTATAMMYEYLPPTDPLGVLDNTPFGYLTTSAVYEHVCGEDAANKCLDGITRISEHWPVPEDGGSCTLGLGDFGALEFFYDFISGLIRQQDLGGGDIDHHRLVVVVSELAGDYFYERCACGRLLLPGQIQTLPISHVFPPHQCRHFWPCGHTYEIWFPAIPPLLSDCDQMRARTFDRYGAFGTWIMHQDIRSECIRYRQQWVIKRRPNTHLYTHGYPKLYLAPVNMECFSRFPADLELLQDATTTQPLFIRHKE